MVFEPSSTGEPEGRWTVPSYVEDTSDWADWQRDYRLGLILILPPEHVARRIDALRARHDPRSHAICPAHISISDPLRREMTPGLAEEVQAILDQVEPFTLSYHRPHASPHRAGVACPITPQEAIDELKRSLHAASAFDDQVHLRRNIPAHMTIAEFISIEDSRRLCEGLRETVPGGSFLCDRLELIVPDERFHFRRAGAFYLGGRSRK